VVGQLFGSGFGFFRGQVHFSAMGGGESLDKSAEIDKIFFYLDESIE
jgi:hypothetical protein